MDDAQFDVLTRAVVGGGTRRALVRLLAGSVLGAVVARLGSDADTAAKVKKHGPQHNARQRQGQLHAAGKGHKKHKNNHHDRSEKRKDPPQLCAADCEELGGHCCPDGGGCAEAGQCCAGEQKCADGACYDDQFCCPGERRCTANDSCIPPDQCCPDDRRCPDGTCVLTCCDGERMCDDGSCIPNDACCYDTPPPDCQGVCRQRRCVGGQEVCEDRQQGVFCRSSDGLEGTCCKGQCVRGEIICPRYPWRTFNPATCSCECKTGTDAGGMQCCPAGYPYASGVGTCHDGHGGIVCLIGWSECECPVGSPLGVCCCSPGPV